VDARAGVERVMGFSPEDEAFRFLRLVTLFERAMVDSAIVLLKRTARPVAVRPFKLAAAEVSGGSPVQIAARG
jgi:Polyphosphate kinase 2 (PPK2)